MVHQKSFIILSSKQDVGMEREGQLNVWNEWNYAK